MPSPMTTRRAAAIGLAALLIVHWEGEDLVAKHNSFDPAHVTTVCNGVTNMDFEWLKPGMKFTHQQCEKMLRKIMPKYIAPIDACVPTFADMPPHRQASLISFSYNLGPGTICGDRRHSGQIARYLNTGHFEAACDLMVHYIRANGKVLKGLVNRRTDSVWGENPWCLRED